MAKLFLILCMFFLAGGAITILKNMQINEKDDIPYIMEKKCLKPPTRLC
jgi:hypothetical protein